MYSTCLFCHQSLGANESVEHFPVGQRLAFDASKGRLWVVCSHCLRWNLTPLEERWEAIEECERLYRGERVRAQTDQIGLAKLRDGLHLVRIGQPLRPEFAAWRYGDVFRTRLRRTATWIGAGVAAAGAGAALSVATGVAQVVASGLIVVPPIFIWGSAGLYELIRGYRNNFRALLVPHEGGRPYTTFGTHINEMDLAPAAEGWALNFRHALGLEQLTGHEARRALGVVMPRVNATGARSRTTREASERIAAAGGPDAFITRLADVSRHRAADYVERRARFRRTGTGREWAGMRQVAPVNRGALPFFSVEERLALEMAVHEEDERRALEEEMRPLETAWREAEEIANIADSLLTSPETEEFIRRNRRPRRRQ